MDNTVTLRAVEPEDVDFLYRIENLPQVWGVSWGDAPASRHMLWQYARAYCADIYADRQLRLIIDVDGLAAGTVDISDFDPRNSRAMLGIALDEPYRGRGLASTALRLAIARCRDTLGMHQLAAMIPRDNTPSLRLFAALGFKTAGCLKSWLRRGDAFVDVVLVQLML